MNAKLVERRWRVELLGGLRAASGDLIVTHFESRKIAALFACLALRHPRPQPRELLAEQLWPDEEWEVVRNRLRQGLSSLRHTLEPDCSLLRSVLVTDRSEAGLDSAALTTDVLEFEGELAKASSAASPSQTIECLRRAVALYQGDLLPSFYEEWVLAERLRLDQTYCDALLMLANALGQADDPAGAIVFARRLLAASPMREDAHVSLMRSYAAVGRPSEAQRQYRELERVLREELGASPSESTRALLESLRSSSIAHITPQLAAASGPCITEDLGSEGGAVPLGSPLYVLRPTDSDFQLAIRRGHSIVLVKGPRQIGKTSLLARGFHQARESGARVVLTDFQKLDTEQLASPTTLFRTLAEMIVDQLDLDVDIEQTWSPYRGWNVNFERFLRREVLQSLSTPLVWGLDEVDRLFTTPYSNVVFGLFRSWHNERALNPDGSWHRLTLAMAYATEAHLFISDLNQSPFNVGTRLSLEDFTQGEVMELSRRCGSPLRDEGEVARFCRSVGGHPYLVRRGLLGMSSFGLDLDTIEAEVSREDGFFGDHLRRMLFALSQDPILCDSVRGVLSGEQPPPSAAFYRLRSAGIMSGDSADQARLRCGMYAAYLRRHLLDKQS